MLYEASQKEIHIGGVINKQCVLWRMSRLCLGIINPAPGGDKTLSFLFFCSTYVFFQLIGTLIKVWSTRMDCKHGLMISSRLCNCVWMQSELYERSMIYVWLTLVWTFPLGSEPFFPFAYVLISWPSGDFTFFLQRFKWPTLGQWKPVPTRDSYFSFNWACFNLFSSQTPDVQHSCNCWRRGLWFTVIHVILMWFIWLPEVR